MSFGSSNWKKQLKVQIKQKKQPLIAPFGLFGITEVLDVINEYLLCLILLTDHLEVLLKEKKQQQMPGSQEVDRIFFYNSDVEVVVTGMPIRGPPLNQTLNLNL